MNFGYFDIRLKRTAHLSKDEIDYICYEVGKMYIQDKRLSYISFRQIEGSIETKPETRHLFDLRGQVFDLNLTSDRGEIEVKIVLNDALRKDHREPAWMN